MDSKWLAIALVPLAIACSKPNDPKSIATGYLEAIKSGKAAEAQKTYCLVAETSPLTVLTGFTVNNASPQTEGAMAFTAVGVTLQTPQTRLTKVNGAVVNEPIGDVTLQVWNSEDFFNRYVASTAQINAAAQRVSGTAQSSAVPTRDKVSQEPLCVFLNHQEFAN